MQDTSLVAEIDRHLSSLEELARTGQWSELAIALKRRDELVSRVRQDELATVLRAVLDNNDRILDHVKAERKSVTGELLALRRRHRAIGSYESNRKSVLSK